MDEFTEAYIRLIRQGQRAAWLPWWAKARVGRHRGLDHSFLRRREAAILLRLQNTLGLTAAQAKQELEMLCASTGVATHMIPHLPKLDRRWIQEHVRHEGEDGREVLRVQGGVVLTHHSYHHNLLASCFKGWAVSACPVANPPTAFSADDFLYRFTLDLNAKTEANLIGGGRFLYNSDRRALLTGVRELQPQRRVLYMLCDFDEGAPGNAPLPFLGGTLRVPSGVLRLVARQTSLPVFFAGFRFDTSSLRYHVRWQRLPRDESDPGVCAGLDAAYVAAMDSWIRTYPHAWQGWEGG